MNVAVIAGVALVVYLLMTVHVRAETPGVNLIDDIFRDWFNFSESVSTETGVPTTLILAIIRMESAGDPDASGEIGEVGLMQITGAAWEDILSLGSMTWHSSGVPREPYSNILAGAKYLVICNERMGNSIENPVWFDALRAYNVGASVAARDRIRGTNYASRVETFRRYFEQVV